MNRILFSKAMQLALAFILQGQSATAADVCSQLFSASTQSTQGPARLHSYQDLYNQFFLNPQPLPERSRHAWVQVLDRSFKDGSQLSILRPSRNTLLDKMSKRQLSSWSKEWVINLKIEIGSRKDPIKLIPSHGNSGADVFALNWNGKTYYFRPFTLENADTVRKTITASWLNNEILGLHTAAHAQWAAVWSSSNGGAKKPMFGVLSEDAVGELTDVRDPRIESQEAVLTAWAFEYLIGNLDARSHNLMWNGREITVFDHGHAFEFGIHDLSKGIDKFVTRDSLGAEFPKNYTVRFLKAFERLKNPDVQGFLQKSLTPKELQAMQIRIEMMTLDMAAWANLGSVDTIF